MKNPLEFSQNYLSHTIPLFEEYKKQEFAGAMAAIVSAYDSGATLYICGNGGSAGTSGHMVNDLAKGTSVEGKKRLRVIGLADNMSLLTAYANDCGYDSIFVEQLKMFWKKNDVLIAISASGNSMNVVKAAEFARDHGGQVISLVGFNGGKLKELSHHAIHFDSNNYGSIEDAQLMFSHLSSQYMLDYILQSGAE